MSDAVLPCPAQDGPQGGVTYLTPHWRAHSLLILTTWLRCDSVQRGRGAMFRVALASKPLRWRETTMRRKFIEPNDDLGGPCEVHGQQGLAVCALCAAEFCAMCFPGSEICPQCAAESEEDPLDAELDDQTSELWSDDELTADSAEPDSWSPDHDFPFEDDEDDRNR